MRSLLLAILCLGCLGNCLLAQYDDDFIYGTVIDAKSGKPVIFATIQLKAQAKGVITNQDGSFRVPLQFKDTGAVLVVSCLGYDSKEILFSALEQKANNRILIDPQPFQLKEATVVGKPKRPPSARGIVKRAIERISENYPMEPFAYIGYYRDYQVKKGEYVNLNEALLQINDFGFHQNDFDQTAVQVLRYHRNDTFERDSMAQKPYDYATKQKTIENAFLYNFGGNEFNILRIHDPIRNNKENTFSYVYRLQRDLLKNHSVERAPDQSMHGDRMFVIAFEKGKYASDYRVLEGEGIHTAIRAKGTLYISQTTYAIHKLEYAVFDHTARQMQKSKQDGSDVKLVFEIAVEYKPNGDKMYPNYLSLHNVFTLKKKPFYVKEVRFEADKGCFEVTFNKSPILWIDRIQDNFVMKYKRKRVKIARVQRTSSAIQLFPEKTVFQDMVDDLERYGIAEFLSPKMFALDFVNILDNQGNSLGAATPLAFEQFREFFAQELLPAPSENKNVPYAMEKSRPMYKSTIPTSFRNTDGYWLNTPLKSKTNP
ncbi:MAG: carboxypeptidase-like regulatory domain-containing protein [Bacteroidota bacterium]